MATSSESSQSAGELYTGAATRSGIGARARLERLLHTSTSFGQEKQKPGHESQCQEMLNPEMAKVVRPKTTSRPTAGDCGYRVNRESPGIVTCVTDDGSS